MKKEIFTPVIFLTLSTVFFLFLLVHPSAIGISYDWQMPISKVTLTKYPITSAWQDGPILPINPLYKYLYYSALFSIGSNAIWATILLLILGVGCSGYTLFLLMREITDRYWPAIVSGFIYMASADLFLKIYFGWLDYLIGYALIPLVLYLFLRFLKYQNYTTAFLGGLVFTIAASGQPQLFVVAFVLLLIYGIWRWRLWRRILIGLAIYIFVYCVMSLWWIGAYFGDVTNVLEDAKNNLSVSYAGFQQNSILNLLQLPFVIWSMREYTARLHIPWLSYMWTIASIGLFSVPMFVYALFGVGQNQRKWASFFVHLIVLLFGLVLVKGTSQPLSVTGVLFYQIPIISSLFRNINHLYYFIPFSISVLTGLSLSHIKSMITKKHTQYFASGVTYTLITILLLPFILNIYQSRINTYKLDNDSYADILEKYKEPLNNRLLWLPFGFYVKYHNNQDSETGITYTGVNPLMDAVMPRHYIDRTDQNGIPSLLTKLIGFGYCDRIPSCSEKIIGLQSTKDIVNLKRDFQSAIPLVYDKQYYRDISWYSNKAIGDWLHGLKKASMTYENDALDVYTLDSEMITPHVYVPTSIDAVYAQRGALFHGVAVDRDVNTAYLINPERVSDVTKIILPLDFTEDSDYGISHSSTELLTTLKVPEDGNYYLYYYQKRKTSTSPLTLYTVKSVDHQKRIIRFVKMDVESKPRNEDPVVKSGYIYLMKGSYSISFINSINVNNNIINSSFEHGLWNGTSYNCNPDPATLSIVEEKDRRDVLHILSKSKEACQTVVVGDLVPKQKYIFSYDIKHSYGAQPTICLATTEDGYCRGSNNEWPMGSWQHREFIYEQGDTNRAIITIRVPASDEPSENSVDNLELRQVGIPESLAFVKEGGKISGSARLVEYRKINDAKYRVILRSASGNVPLVFGEKYDKRWRAYVMRIESNIPQYTGGAYISKTVNGTVQNDNIYTGSTKETVGKRFEGRHREVNGGFNQWVISSLDSARDVEVVIEYSPQKSLVISQVIALSTAVLIVGSAIVVIIKKERGSRTRY